MRLGYVLNPSNKYNIFVVFVIDAVCFIKHTSNTKYGSQNGNWDIWLVE